MRISDWSSDVCSSDLVPCSSRRRLASARGPPARRTPAAPRGWGQPTARRGRRPWAKGRVWAEDMAWRRPRPPPAAGWRRGRRPRAAGREARSAPPRRPWPLRQEAGELASLFPPGLTEIDGVLVGQRAGEATGGGADEGSFDDAEAGDDTDSRASRRADASTAEAAVAGRAAAGGEQEGRGDKSDRH